MERRTEFDSKIVDWLAAMGYPVAGMPEGLLHGMLVREARQWQISPERLETMILEDAGHGARAGAPAAGRPRRTPPVSRTPSSLALSH